MPSKPISYKEIKLSIQMGNGGTYHSAVEITLRIFVKSREQNDMSNVMRINKIYSPPTFSLLNSSRYTRSSVVEEKDKFKSSSLALSQ